MLSVLPTLILALLPLSSALRVPLDLDASLNTASSLSSDARVQVENTAHRLFAGEIDLATAVKHYTNLKLDSRSTILDVDLNAATDVDVYLQTKLRQALDLQAKIHAEAQAKADAKGKAKVATRTVGISLPDIYAGASFCVTLASDLQISNSVTLSAGTCICVDAAVAGGLQGPVTVYTSSGATFTGELAVKIRDSLLLAQFGSLFLDPATADLLRILGLLFSVQVTADVCVQANVFLGIGEHDFTQGTGQQCCARRCTGNTVPSGPNGECTCPAANACQNQCLSGPAIECAGQCYLASQYTCPSGVPTLRQVGKKRNLDICFGFGNELCAVAGSKGWECVNVLADIESCGGCVHANANANDWSDSRIGNDCTSIPFVDEVICNLGDCQVLSCEQGYKPSRNATLCLAIDLKADINVDADVDVDVDVKAANHVALDLIGSHL